MHMQFSINLLIALMMFPKASVFNCSHLMHLIRYCQLQPVILMVGLQLFYSRQILSKHFRFYLINSIA